MSQEKLMAQGKAEMSALLRKWWSSILSIGLFSVFVNLLMLTGPLFMLQIYDRVLGSRSVETLVALVVLVAILYAIMGVLDYARGRIAARLGASFQDNLDGRVFDILMRRAVSADERSRPATGLQDLDAIQRLLSSPALFAFFDLPWTPVFLAAIFIFHPLLGILAVCGGGLLIIITLLNQRLTRRPVGLAARASAKADITAESLRAQAEVIRGLGMHDQALNRWGESRSAALDAQILASDRTGVFTTLSKTLRLFLQSAMLALGAWLVLRNEMTAGAMIAGSIMLGRALAPIEQAIAQWPLVLRARQGQQSIALLLGASAPEPTRTKLPKPKAYVELSQVTVLPPGEKVATLRMVSFRVEPGQALGVIGESASGKSTLARVLTGIWPPISGKARLDGAALEQYGQTTLGNYIGYLPQDVTLFNGSIAENIARLDPNPDPEKVVLAAKKADAHDMILKLPDGYDTQISSGGGRLSGGQKQRIGLARAMYGDPVLLVLDEPNSNLDSHGGEALNAAIRAIKAEGGVVIIMAHRPSGIAECDLVLVLDGGMVKAFGPRDEVLKGTVQNYAQVVETISQKDVS
ncbi:MAG: type I secretion system permease/ATPase [Rhodobacteraceae bacterium]|nr:type I secretion system permease/ATPase [Paracoccaceae bacterium]